MNTYLRIVSWNVEGLTSKLNFDDFVKYVCNFEIVCLLETSSVNENEISSIFKDYLCFKIDALKHKKLGRPMVEICLLVKNYFQNYVKQIVSTCKFCVFLRITKELVHTTKDLLYIYW